MQPSQAVECDSDGLGAQTDWRLSGNCVLAGIWVVNAERLGCIAACGDRYTLSPGRNAAGQQSAVCAASVAEDKSGLRPGYNVRGKPNTCMIQDGDGYIAAEEFSCYCVLVPPPDQK